MKFALSTLSTAVLTITFMSLTIAPFASANDNTIKSQNALTADNVTQIVDANHQNYSQNDSQNDSQKIGTQDSPTVTTIESENAERQPDLSTLIDPITHKSIDNSYPLEVSSLLSLEQAQNVLLQVSPKIAANQAAIASSEFETDALKTIDNPLVFAQVSANAYNLDTDIDLSTLKNGIVNDINNNVDSVIPPIPELPNFGELVGDRLPDSYNLKHSGSTTGAGLGVVWPIYTAGRTTALTGASNARTQEAVADSILDKNELYNTLIERYFKAQLAIIAAYLRDDRCL